MIMIKKVISYIIKGLTVLFFVLAFVIIIVGIKGAKENKPIMIFGYMYSVVPTESMMPDINPGDFVFSKKKEYSELKVNQDVIYYSEEKDIYIVHRIYKDNLDGTYQMKGINNSDVDDEYLTEDNYVASVVKVVTLLNAGTTMMNNKSLIFIFIIVIFLGLFIAELFKIILTYKEEKLKEDKKLIQEKKNKFIEEEKNKMREEILKELQEENEKAKLSKESDAKL